MQLLVFLQEYLAIGEAPDQIRNCYQQRSRWCKVRIILAMLRTWDPGKLLWLTAIRLMPIDFNSVPGVNLLLLAVHLEELCARVQLAES